VLDSLDIHSSFAPEHFVPTHAGGVFRLPIRVYNQDIDAGRVVFVANYLKFMERTRTEWVRALGGDFRQMERALRQTFVIRHVDASYLRPAFVDDLLLSEVSMSKLGRSYCVLAQRIEKDGVTLCDATVTAVCVDVVRFKPVPIPDFLHREFARELKLVRGA